MNKECSNCKVVKRHEARGLCKVCYKQYQRTLPNTKLSHKLYTRKKRETDQVYLRKANLKKNYNLTVDAYNLKLVNQGFKCPICDVELLGDRYTHVDHDHVTGEVRDLLCHKCNKGLGHIENSEFLEKCLVYLDKHKSRNKV